MQIEVSASNRQLLCLVVALVAVSVVGYAYSQAPNPGHSSGDIEFLPGTVPVSAFVYDDNIPSNFVDFRLGPNLFITPEGNVGIGTGTPKAKLDVAGDINGTVFYDKDDSNYYVNPSGISRVFEINALSMISSQGMIKVGGSVTAGNSCDFGTYKGHLAQCQNGLCTCTYSSVYGGRWTVI